jgi:hypothetical protein
MADADPLSIVLRAITYPYQVPQRSFIVMGPHCVPFDVDNFALLQELKDSPLMPVNGDVREILEGLQTRHMMDQHFTPILAAGSNASPEQLARKLGSIPQFAIPVIYGQIRGWSSVYSAHVTRYGAIPATLFRDRHATTHLHCLFVPKRLIDIFDQSEGSSYKLQPVPDVSFVSQDPNSPIQMETSEPCAYMSVHGAMKFVSDGPLRLDQVLTDSSQFRSANETRAVTLLAKMMRQRTGIWQFINKIVVDQQFRDECNKYIAENLSITP